MSGPLSVSVRLLLQVAIFGAAALALYTAGRPSPAHALGATVAVNGALLYVWKQ